MGVEPDGASRPRRSLKPALAARKAKSNGRAGNWENLGNVVRCEADVRDSVDFCVNV
jgi:hypothetical protein